MDLEDVRDRANVRPLKILRRPIDTSKPALLEEQDSGYESNDQAELKTIGRSTYKWDIRDRIRKMQRELEALEGTLPV